MRAVVASVLFVSVLSPVRAADLVLKDGVFTNRNVAYEQKHPKVPQFDEPRLARDVPAGGVRIETHPWKNRSGIAPGLGREYRGCYVVNVLSETEWVGEFRHFEWRPRTSEDPPAPLRPEIAARTRWKNEVAEELRQQYVFRGFATANVGERVGLNGFFVLREEQVDGGEPVRIIEPWRPWEAPTPPEP